MYTIIAYSCKCKLTANAKLGMFKDFGNIQNSKKRCPVLFSKMKNTLYLFASSTRAAGDRTRWNGILAKSLVVPQWPHKVMG